VRECMRLCALCDMDASRRLQALMVWAPRLWTSIRWAGLCDLCGRIGRAGDNVPQNATFSASVRSLHTLLSKRSLPLFIAGAGRAPAPVAKYARAEKRPVEADRVPEKGREPVRDVSNFGPGGSVARAIGGPARSCEPLLHRSIKARPHQPISLPFFSPPNPSSFIPNARTPSPTTVSTVVLLDRRASLKGLHICSALSRNTFPL
jgi:hypothetical protein